MLQLKSFTVDHDRPMVPMGCFSHFPTYLLSLRVLVFNTTTLAHILDSLVRVSRRVICNLFVRIHWALTSIRSFSSVCKMLHIEVSTNSQGFHNLQTHSNSTLLQSLDPNRNKTKAINTSRKSFPFNDFRYFLTLFSKFFSSFARATCSLSVSRQYLAFDGVYHQLWAAVPNNSTLWNRTVRYVSSSQIRDSHPLWCPVPRDSNRTTQLVSFL